MSFIASVKIDPQHVATQDATPLAFNTSVYDKAADFDRPYVVRIYAETQEIEIFDVKNQRLFLKKQRNPELQLHQFRPGNVVLLYGRQHNVLSYANQFTENMLKNDFQRTFGVIKPGKHLFKAFADACDRIAASGLHFTKLQLSYISSTTAAQIYAFKKDESYYPDLVKTLTGDSIFFEIAGNDCRQKWRDIVGDKDPRKCSPGQLRAKYGTDILNNAFVAFKTDELALEAGDVLLQLRPICASSANGGVAQETSCLIIYDKTIEKSAKIIDYMLDNMPEGLKISGLHAALPTAADIQELLASYNGVIACWQEYCNQMSAGLCIAVEVTGSGVVQKLRELVGPFDPQIARVLRPASIRAQFGVDGVDNSCFVTDIEEEGVIHSDFWFNVIE